MGRRLQLQTLAAKQTPPSALKTLAAVANLARKLRPSGRLGAACGRGRLPARLPLWESNGETMGSNEDRIGVREEEGCRRWDTFEVAQGLHCGRILAQAAAAAAAATRLSV